ncbi:hypothetical protein ABG067_007872 [Albugo candida]
MTIINNEENALIMFNHVQQSSSRLQEEFMLRDEEYDNCIEEDELREKEKKRAEKKRERKIIKKQIKKEKVLKLIAVIQQVQTSHVLNTLMLVNKDVFYIIYIGGLHLLEARVVTRREPGGRSSEWWQLEHPNLVDQPENGAPVDRRLIFKNHYRITLRTFERLVNRLMQSRAYAGCVAKPSSWAVYKQVAIVLWRFSNTSYGYRLALSKFKVGEGSYNEFTNRFVKAMVEEIQPEVIQWPSTSEEFTEIARGMARTADVRKPRLENVCGATDEPHQYEPPSGLRS